MYTRTPKRWFCSSNKGARIARIMAIGAADFSLPRSLGMDSAISPASFCPSSQLYLRRNISFDQTSIDPSSSTPNLRSFSGIQSFVDKPYNMNYVVPHNVMLPNDQFVTNSEDCQSTYLPPEYPQAQNSKVEDWIKETIRLELDKRRWRPLELSDDTENSTPKIKGYDKETDSVKKSVSVPSFCSPKLDLSGGDRGTWIPQMMDSSIEISSSLKQDTLGDAQSNGLSIQNLETAECNTAYKGELKSDGLKEANVVNHHEFKSDGLKEANVVNHRELKSDGLKEVNVVNHRKNLFRIYEDVLVVDDVLSAKKIVKLLTTKYRNLVHACDTEVAKIAVKQDTPVDHGEMICFSIYSGPEVDFGNGKSCIWVDVLDGGGRELLMEFAPFFEDPSIRKVWHNYSFDSHVIENYGIRLSGFHADTMHMARLWDSSRRTEGGYSLEALTSDSKVMNGDPTSDSHVKNVSCSPIYGELLGKISMKTIFGKKKFRRDGSVGSVTTIPPVEELQKNERNLWISYSALDSMSTLHLFESLRSKLEKMVWFTSGKSEAEGSMYDFYEAYWKPFGQLLVKMETEGVLVDRSYLAEIEKVAALEQKTAGNRFRKWAAKYCPDAIHMNVGSDIQVRQLFYGGILNRKDPNEALPLKKSFKMPNINNVIEEGKTAPSKFHTITLTNLGATMEPDTFTPTGWPSVSGDSLKALAGKVSAEYDWINDIHGFESDTENPLLFNDLDAFTSRNSDKEDDVSSYGRAYKAFEGNKEGKEACHAISALCEVRAIDSLISSFILPLQSNHISGKDGRIHCSLNINTETGRLSARRPNLQNQPALEKDRYKIRQAFIAAPGNSLIVADYGQLELRILAHLADCKSMKDAFKAGGDFHSRTAMNMYSHIREAVEKQEVLLEWHPQLNQDKPPVPLLKDAFASERRKAKMLNFSIAYGKTPHGLAKDWKVSLKEAKETVDLWYKDRKEVLRWQEKRKQEANKDRCVKTLLGRTRMFPSMKGASFGHRAHIERAAINTPVQGSAADVAMCGMLEIERNKRLKELGWRLLLQVHDEVILEGPTESGEEAKAIVVECLSKPFNGTNILDVDLAVDAKCAQNWYAAK